jgi:sortase A
VEPSRRAGFLGRATRGQGQWRLAEALAWAFGVACLVGWGTLRLESAAGARQELERFAALQDGSSQPAVAVPVAMPDLSLWDDERVAAWQSTLADPTPPPLAVLRIPRIHLEVPAPGTEGNSAIAGHRDGFFRGLKDIEAGDVIEVETLAGKEAYHVERFWVVAPEDIWVLDSTPTRSITLVTCYPFYHVGPAPRRYIVRAVRAGEGAVDPVGVALAR